LRLGGEAADSQVPSEQEDAEGGGSLEIEQVAVQPAELGVAISHLLVDGDELFVGGLQLFLGRFQFLIDALQLLVGGLDLLVGLLEFLAGGLVLFLDGLEVVARLGQFALQLSIVTGDGRAFYRR